MSVLEAERLHKYFPIRSKILRRTVGHVRAVDGVDLRVASGETLGIVGESGCGKSTLGRLLVRLIDPTGGELRHHGQRLGRLSRDQERQFRRSVQIVFQNPYASLDSRLTVGRTLLQPLRLHRMPGDHRQLVADALRRVGLEPADADRYPHEFSGGQRQRVAIARALMLQPELIVCDEATSALDVSVQAQIIELLDTLRRETGVSLIFISHDLSVVERLCDRIMVMYLGRVMESAPAADLFDDARHPYSKALLAAIPVPDPVRQRARPTHRLAGQVPSPADPPPGCPFQTRCPEVVTSCREVRPELRPIDDTRQAACHLA